MAEAAEHGHWVIVKTMADTLGDREVSALAELAVGAQARHFETVRAGSPELARIEVSE